MGRDLTKRYSGLFESKGLVNPLLLARDIFRYRKTSELASFAVWELLHQLKLFPKSKYLPFNGQPMTLRDQSPRDPDLATSLERHFRSKGLSLAPVEHNWKVIFATSEREFYGCIYPDDRALYRSTDGGESIELLTRFPERIKSLYVSNRNTLFVCVKGAVYRSPDDGKSFERVLELGSSESFFRHNNGMTETPAGTLIIGEYGNVWNETEWKKLAYLYFSSDDGETWETSDFLIRQGTNKHVHLVRYSHLFDRVFMADGDNYKKLWMSDASTSSGLQDPERWTPVTRIHIQTGGYTSVTETDRKILFGTDYQGGTNFVVESSTGDDFRKRVVPDPYRRSPIMNMVPRRSTRGDEVWAYLPYSTGGANCLLTYSPDGGDSWNSMIEYSKAQHKVWLVNASRETLDVLYFSIEHLNSGDRVVYAVRDA